MRLQKARNAPCPTACIKKAAIRTGIKLTQHRLDGGRGDHFFVEGSKQVEVVEGHGGSP